MKIFKKADAEIRAQIFREGDVANSKVTIDGGKTNLAVGFEAICRGLLDTMQKQSGRVATTVFADVMEETLKMTVEGMGVKSLDEMLEDLKEGAEAGGIIIKVPAVVKMKKKNMEEAQKESGEADA